MSSRRTLGIPLVLDPSAPEHDGGLVQLSDIRAARARLRDVVVETPLRSCRALSEIIGGEVYLKCENLQRTGSFKLRGAYARLSALTTAERRAGVVAASAGNHAQGVALAAQLLGVRSTVFMPVRAPLPKVAATRGYGAHVRNSGATVDDALQAAAMYAAETGAVLVHPFDHVDVLAGQATVGLEVLEQCPRVRTVLAPAGGGGLVSGIAAATKRLAPDVTVVGVQAAGAAALPPSVATGRPVRLSGMTTLADGIAVGCPSELTYLHVRELVDEVLTVTEDDLARGVLMCLERARLVVELAGAAGVAALLAQPDAFRPPVVVVLSGGNIDPILLGKVLQHGLSAAGRHLALRVTVRDEPGALAALLQELAHTGANVLDVEHHRTGPGLNLDEVGVEVRMETRGPGHSQDVIRHLECVPLSVREL